MIDITNKKCIKCNKKQGNFNYEGEIKGFYCSSCKEEGMIDVVNKSCISEHCYVHVNNSKYEGYCLRCFIHLYPDNIICRNYKTKEYTVVSYITEKYKGYDWVYNKRIQNGKYRRYPDLMLVLKDFIIIIEIDENQHKYYDCSCENKRLMEISTDLGHKPIIFLRFNPDSYYDYDNKKVKSPWKVNSLGLCIIDDKDEWENRLYLLTDKVDYFLENKTDKTIEIIQLFFDMNL